MKQQDIKTGIVYGLKSLKKARPIAMVVVSTAHRYEKNYAGPRTLPDGKVLRERIALDRGRDFMCVGILGDPDSVSHDELLAAAATCSLPEIDGEFDDYNELTRSVLKTYDPRLWITFLPAKEFAGEFEAEAARVQSMQESNRSFRDAQAAEDRRIRAIADRLSELTGVDLNYGVSDDNFEVKISIRSLEALVGRVEAMRSANPLNDGAL